jgi:hypothetical protein
MKVFTCVDHAGYWVGVASVIVAPSEEEARRLLSIELRTHGLRGNQPFTLQPLDLTEPKAFVLIKGMITHEPQRSMRIRLALAEAGKA